MFGTSLTLFVEGGSGMGFFEPQAMVVSSLPNELRIDAAERDIIRRTRGSAAASNRVERSRTPEHTALLEIKAEGQARKIVPDQSSTNQ